MEGAFDTVTVWLKDLEENDMFFTGSTKKQGKKKIFFNRDLFFQINSVKYEQYNLSWKTVFLGWGGVASSNVCLSY